MVVYNGVCVSSQNTLLSNSSTANYSSNNSGRGGGGGGKGGGISHFSTFSIFASTHTHPHPTSLFLIRQMQIVRESITHIFRQGRRSSIRIHFGCRTIVWAILSVVDDGTGGAGEVGCHGCDVAVVVVGAVVGGG